MAFDSTDLAQLARLISPQQAEAMVRRIHTKYPTLHAELWDAIRTTHPALQQDVSDAVLREAPTVYARTDVRLRGATTDEERLTILREAVTESSEARRAVLDTVNARHAGLYATVFRFLATEYPGALLEVAAAWWETRDPDEGSGG